MQHVEGAWSISCFSFMPFRMLIVSTLNQSSYAKYSILLKDKQTFLDEEGIGLQMEFIGWGPPVSHHNIQEMEDYCFHIQQYSVVAVCAPIFHIFILPR